MGSFLSKLQIYLDDLGQTYIPVIDSPQLPYLRNKKTLPVAWKEQKSLGGIFFSFLKVML